MDKESIRGELANDITLHKGLSEIKRPAEQRKVAQANCKQLPMAGCSEVTLEKQTRQDSAPRRALLMLAA